MQYAERIEAERRRRNTALQLARNGLASAKNPWIPKAEWASSIRSWIEHHPWQSTGGAFGIGFLCVVLIKMLGRGDTAKADGQRIHVTLEEPSSKAGSQEPGLESVLDAALKGLNATAILQILNPSAAYNHDNVNGHTPCENTSPESDMTKAEAKPVRCDPSE